MTRGNYDPPSAPVAAPLAPRSRLRIFLVILFVGIPISFIVFYLCYIQWDISNLRSTCSALKAGTTIAEARKILVDHHFSDRFPYVSSDFPNGIPADPPGTWYDVIDADSTMGDVSCGIHHDGKMILSAEESEE